MRHKHDIELKGIKKDMSYILRDTFPRQLRLRQQDQIHHKPRSCNRGGHTKSPRYCKDRTSHRHCSQAVRPCQSYSQGKISRSSSVSRLVIVIKLLIRDCLRCMLVGHSCSEPGQMQPRERRERYPSFCMWLEIWIGTRYSKCLMLKGNVLMTWSREEREEEEEKQSRQMSDSYTKE